MGMNLCMYCGNGKVWKLRIVIIGTIADLLRCLSKDLIPVSVRLKSTINTRKAKQITHRAERQLLQERD